GDATEDVAPAEDERDLDAQAVDVDELVGDLRERRGVDALGRAAHERLPRQLEEDAAVLHARRERELRALVVASPRAARRDGPCRRTADAVGFSFRHRASPRLILPGLLLHFGDEVVSALLETFADLEANEAAD